MRAALQNATSKLTGSKWLVWGLIGLGIFLLILNLFIGGGTAPDIPASDVPAPSADGEEVASWTTYFPVGNIWLGTTILLAVFMTANWMSKQTKRVPVKTYDATSGTWVESKETHSVPRFQSRVIWLAAGALMVVAILVGFMPDLLAINWGTNPFTSVNWFWWIALLTILGVLAFGTKKLPLIAGNTSAYVAMAAISLVFFLGIIYFLAKFMIGDVADTIISSVQADAQCMAGTILKGGVCEDTTTNWDALFDKDTWIQIAVVALLTLAPVVVLHQYLTKNPWVVYPLSALALVIFFGSVYYILKNYEPAREVYEDVSGALGAANETVNPFLGEDHFVNLVGAPGHRLVVANIGPNDTLTVSVPPGSSVDWQAYPGYESVPGYDPTGYYLYNTTGSSGFRRYYAFTEDFKQGLKATGKTLTLEIWAVK